MKIEVHLQGGLRKIIDITPGATVGATVGVNLRNPDGTLWVPPSSGGGGVSVTAWELILNIPPNVVALGNTSTTGLYVITGPGTSETREVVGTAGDIAVADGDGVSGNPTVSMVPTGVAPGSYTSADITVDANGRITAAADGGGGGGVLPVVTGEILSGQPVFVYGPDGSLVYGPVV